MPARRALRLLGRRLPTTQGTIEVPGLARPLQIRRDRWGIPHVRAANAQDAWFGVGFCHAQDRAFQLELMVRAARGTLAALVGREGLPVDRLSRRLGIHAAAEAQLAHQGDEVRGLMESYARGVNAGLERGARRRPHELALLRARPSTWTVVDALAIPKVLGIGGLAENWTQEHARLMVSLLDGEEAVGALEPAYPDWLATIADLRAFTRATGTGGGSNNWVLAGERTASGRPLLANDPHLPPTVPGLFYLAHVATPEWDLVGATTVGCPGLVSGHNGHAAWGVTSGMADVADLSIEQVGPDGASVRERDGFVPCELREERIEVRGGKPVVERVLVTPRGPIVSPAVEGGTPALALRCALLDPTATLSGPLVAQRTREFADVQRTADGWPFPLNVVYADAAGRIGWQFTGRIPRRPPGSGSVPTPGWEGSGDWDGWLAADELPSASDPDCGFLATANNKPLPDGAGPDMGADWMDGYRAHAIGEALAARTDWDVEATLALQRDERSLPWRELTPVVLALGESGHGEGAAVRRGLGLLAAWDGVVAADSPAAAVFELLLAELAQRVVRARAPRSAAWALGHSANPIAGHTILGMRRTSQLVRLLRERPQGWFAGGWDAELAAALGAAVRRLEREHGPDPAGWAWGSVRTLRFEHALGARKPLDRVFNLPAIPFGGDTNTIPQASVDPLHPTGNPVFVPTLRTAIEPGDWEGARFVLATGQSGNPLSPHYDDQHALWRRGEAVAIPLAAAAVEAATVATLHLEPER